MVVVIRAWPRGDENDYDDVGDKLSPTTPLSDISSPETFSRHDLPPLPFPIPG